MAIKERIKSKLITTPVGTAMWPALIKPHTKYKPDGEYVVKLRLGDVESAQLRAQITDYYEASYLEMCRIEGKKTLKRADLPFKRHTDKEGNETGDWAFKFSQKALVRPKNGDPFSIKIAIVDAHNRPFAGDAIWGGSLLQVCAFLEAFYVPAVGFGVSARIKGVRILKCVTGMTAEDMFGDPVGAEDAAPDTDGENPVPAPSGVKGDF